MLKGVLEALFANHASDSFTVFATPFNRSLIKRVPANVRMLTLPISGFYSQLSEIASKDGIGILFRSYPVEDQLSFPFQRQIFFIPDIQHEDHPEFFPAQVLRSRRVAFHQALTLAGAIGTLTEFTRETLRQHPWTECRDIFLMGPASPISLFDSISDPLTVQEIALLERKFFLYPANLWPHKNHRRILQAFAVFHKRKARDIELFLTGDPTGWAELRAEFSGLPVRHLGFVRPSFLYALLKRAQALVFFSLYEGFGIPLLEAFDLGTPVICSPLPSLLEVGGDAILTADPLNVAAMADAMAQIVEDVELRKAMIEKGKVRVNQFSWAQSADNLMKACRRVAGRAVSDQLVVSTNSAPLVSIVTPSFNQARFLKRTIESVLSQNYPHIEYVVIDGGSTDGSVELLRSYGSRFRWVSEPDRGQAHAINKGFAQTRGSIRAYLNSDDCLLPNAVETVVRVFQQHPDWDLVYGQAFYIDEEDRIIGMYPTAEYSFSRLMQDCCICQPAAFWRSRIADLVGPFNEELHYALDYEYWLRIDRAGGRIAHVPDVLAASRLYPETKTLSARLPFYREIFKVCQQYGGYVDKNYFWGLWHHRLSNNQPPGLYWLGKLPGFYPLVVAVHHWLYHYRLRPITIRLGSLHKRFLNWLAHNHPLAYYGLHWRIAKTFPRTNRRRRVFGFWPDGWLAPLAQIYLPHPAVGQAYYLQGRAPVPMTLKLRVSGSSWHEHHLPANEELSIPIKIESSGPTRIYLSFSRFIVDLVSRPLAFRIEDTNLFSERDL
ncbi:glycosyltransferase [Thermoanaerobaculum aquaticum]|uniref:glycosyltransferase n=1 Tax=Thermoanaerobaculum aquaticum TaxID=1312852 RepID=UPI00137759A2|nr:glycosyltransferase [Thermoanaerobaculum aquaticum]